MLAVQECTLAVCLMAATSEPSILVWHVEVGMGIDRVPIHYVRNVVSQQ